LLTTRTSDWFQIVRVFLNHGKNGQAIENVHESKSHCRFPLIESEEKFSSVVFTEQPSKPPPLENSTEPTTQAPVEIADSFVSFITSSETVSGSF